MFSNVLKPIDSFTEIFYCIVNEYEPRIGPEIKNLNLHDILFVWKPKLTSVFLCILKTENNTIV